MIEMEIERRIMGEKGNSVTQNAYSENKKWITLIDNWGG